MPIISFRGTCTNPGCRNRAVQAMTIDSSKTPRCGSCAQPLTAEPPPKVGRVITPYEKAKNDVRAASAKGTPAALWAEEVMKFLDTNAKFQGDFIEEMKKEIDVGKFATNAGATVRSAKADDVCVDNAFAHVGLTLPANCPKGEKFSFEPPCILAKAGWTYFAVCREHASLLSTPFEAVRTAIATEAETRQYLVIWTPNAGQSESHMIAITVAPRRSNAWIYDPQEQPNNYAGGFCEAWMKPTTGGEKKMPYCTIDLDTGKRGEYVKAFGK